MKIKTWRDPYNAGFSPTKPTEIELRPGVTVLVGCNGAGKSTLLHNIEEHCQNNKISCHMYDNLQSGGINSIASLINDSKSIDAIQLMNASEGENIRANIYRESRLYDGFFENGYVDNRLNKLTRLFADKDTLEEMDNQRSLCKDRVLLYDAVDSGLSIDSVLELKIMFDRLLSNAQKVNINLYIVIAANEYELARNSSCFDVNSGNYLVFKDYEDYRNFIIKSSVLKMKRIEQQIKWQLKKKQQEIAKYIKLRTTTEENKRQWLIKHKNKPLSYSEQRKLDSYDDIISDYIRSCRFASKKDLERAWEN